LKKLIVSTLIAFALFFSAPAKAQTPFPFEDGTLSKEFMKLGWYWDFTGNSEHELFYSIIDPTDGVSDPSDYSGYTDNNGNPCTFIAMPAGVEAEIDNFANRVNLSNFKITLTKRLEDTDGPGDIRIGATHAGCNGSPAAYARTYWSRTDSNNANRITGARIYLHVGQFDTGGSQNCSGNVDTFDFKHPNDSNLVNYNGCSGTSYCATSSSSYDRTSKSLMASGSTSSITGSNNTFTPSNSANCYGRCVAAWGSQYDLIPQLTSGVAKEPIFFTAYDIAAL